MQLYLNVAILVLGSTGAIAAFGGDTWHREELPWSRRVTGRGWLALTCMIATLCLGIVKEVHNGNLAAASAARQEQLANQLDNALLVVDALGKQNTALLEQLDIAETRITSAISDSKSSHTDATRKLQKELAEMKGEIAKTRYDSKAIQKRVSEAKEERQKVKPSASNGRGVSTGIKIEPNWVDAK